MHERLAGYILGMILLLLACPRAPEPATLAGEVAPQVHAEVDVLRPWKGAEKLYIQVELPEGHTGIFLVDTGSGITMITPELASALKISSAYSGGTISGLSGTHKTRTGVLPSLAIGDVRATNLTVAITPGAIPGGGLLPVDGILGNNFFHDYVLAIDYPADVLEIGSAGTVAVPDGAVPMAFDGSNVSSQVTLKVQGRDYPVRLELDTGAWPVLLSGVGFPDLVAVATEGEEPIIGLGASDRLPASAFYRRTRHVPLDAATLGGVEVKVKPPATWINYGTAGSEAGPPGFAGLVGGAAWEGNRVVFDYVNGRFGLSESTHPARQIDANEVLLAQDVKAHGARDAERGLQRAQWKAALDDLDGAQKEIEGWLDKHPLDPVGTTMLARVLRAQDEVPAALEQLLGLPIESVAVEGELGALVNALILEGRGAEALEKATAAAEKLPADPWVQVALSDALVAQGKLPEARAALARFARLRQDPDAGLPRRARIALKEGDKVGALAHYRRRLLLYPSDGETLWAYALVAASMGPTERELFKRDAEHAMGRLHPEHRPLDLLAAAWTALGDAVAARAAADGALAGQCAPLEEESARENCEAWVKALVVDGSGLDAVKSALAKTGNRADYLDTLAVVLLARKDYVGAAEAARHAARMDPDRFYYLWQLERIEALKNAPSPTPPRR